MSFIDKTYFIGDLHISQLQQSAVVDRLNYFISIYEPECLKKLLGYELWKAFTDGLLEDSPAQKWLNLRDGAEFTGYNGRLKKWEGLTGTADAVPITAAGYKNSVQVQADVTTGFTSGTNTVTFDGTNGKPDFRKWNIKPERIATGTMWKDQYSWEPNTGVWTLLTAGDVFQPLEKFDIVFEPISTSNTSGPVLVKQSIIANYVYVKWMTDSITSTTGVGEAKPAADNAAVDNPGWKIFRAWQQLRQSVCIMDEFIRQNISDYTAYQYHCLPSEFRHSINPLGI